MSKETPKGGLQDPAFISWSQEATVGERIRWLLEVCQLKQTEIAQKTGITQAAISNWITGSSRKPNSPSLIRLADVLGSNPTWIIYGEGEPFNQKSSPAVVLHPQTIPKTAPTKKREKKGDFKPQQVLPTTAIKTPTKTAQAKQEVVRMEETKSDHVIRGMELRLIRAFRSMSPDAKVAVLTVAAALSDKA